MTVTAAIIGTGDPDGSGTAISYAHAGGYTALDGCELVACADLVKERAEQFAETHELPIDGVYEDFVVMLEAVRPDIVSVCTPVPTHEPIVTAAADTGNVGAIHCEKPMADTWGGARRMAEVCRERGVQLTINHQRRLAAPWRRAKALLDAGEIGELERIETATGPLLDSGPHRFDICNFIMDEQPIDWVFGNIDYRRENVKFGSHNENQSIAQWRYESGVEALAVGDAYTRLCGTDGTIEVRGDVAPPTRVRRLGDRSWSPVDCGGQGIHGAGHVHRAIEEVVASYRTGSMSELRAENALRATELIFAVYESARRPGRVDLPLDIDDNPLEAMVDSGRVNPT